MLQYIGRALLITVLTAGLICGAVFFRTAMRPESAQADVYEVFPPGSVVEPAVPRYIGSFEGDGRVQEVNINGNRLFYTNTMTTHRVKEVLDYYDSLYRRPEIHLTAGAIGRMPAFTNAAVDKILKDIEGRLNKDQSRVVRMEGGAWGLLSYLDMGTNDFLSTYALKGEAVTRSGNIGLLGVSKTVIAMEEDVNRTTILSFWTGPDFNLYNLIPIDGDAEGEDLPDVPRIEGDRRILSTKEADSSAQVRMAVYQAPRSKNQCMLYYLDALRAAGWTKNTLYEKVDVELNNNSTMFYAKRGRELLLSFNENNPATTTVTVIERRL